MTYNWQRLWAWLIDTTRKVGMIGAGPGICKREIEGAMYGILFLFLSAWKTMLTGER